MEIKLPKTKWIDSQFFLQQAHHAFFFFFSCKTQWCSKVKTLDNFFFWQCGYVRSLITSIDFIWYLIFDWYNCRFFLPSPYSVTEPKSEQKKFQGDSDSIVYAMQAICILIKATCMYVCLCVRHLRRKVNASIW